MEGYYSLNRYLQEEFGEKIYRLLLDPGTGCPNRDGTISNAGCSFCKSGNTEFSEACCGSLKEQILKAKKRISSKTSAKKFIAYFGVGTATYGNPEVLERLYKDAADMPEVVALSLGTRPDCLASPVLDVLEKINREKPVWVELGLQTAREKTADLINRGYPNKVYETAVKDLHVRGIKIIPHLILGLPGESPEDMMESVRYVCSFPLDGIKLHLLSVLKDTPMADQYEKNPWKMMEPEEYAFLLFDIISFLPSDIVLHRFTGDGAKKDLIAPLWTADKKRVLNTIHKIFAENGLQQGSRSFR